MAERGPVTDLSDKLKFTVGNGLRANVTKLRYLQVVLYFI